MSSAAHADRDIVFAARYYLKPGLKGHSHFHLYRVNANGSGRTQITRGNGDDTQPKWSPDGSKLLFQREIGGHESLCVVGAAGGKVTTLYSDDSGALFNASWDPTGRKLAFVRYENDPYFWSVWLLDSGKKNASHRFHASDYAWSPDGWRIYLSSEEAEGRVMDLHTGKFVAIGPKARAGVWLDANILVAYFDLSTPTLRILSADGSVRMELAIPFKDSDITGDNGFPDALYVVPGSPDQIIYGARAGDSTGGRREALYAVNLKTGHLCSLGLGQYLAWGPDGKHFVTGDARDLAERGKNNYVWVSNLSVVSLDDAARKIIVSGLVWVDGFDWRKAK